VNLHYVSTRSVLALMLGIVDQTALNLDSYAPFSLCMRISHRKAQQICVEWLKAVAQPTGPVGGCDFVKKEIVKPQADATTAEAFIGEKWSQRVGDESSCMVGKVDPNDARLESAAHEFKLYVRNEVEEAMAEVFVREEEEADLKNEYGQADLPEKAVRDSQMIFF